MKESGEMYLETIYILSREKEEVHAIDVCKYMHFSKPSVSRALTLLKNDSYIFLDESDHIHLTDAGLDIAKKIFERHNVLSGMLIQLGVNPQTAVHDACRMEHVISDETFSAIKKFHENKPE